MADGILSDASRAIPVMAPLLMAVLGGVVLSTPSAAAPLAPVAFSDLPGWERDAHEAAFATFRRSCAVAVKDPPKTRGLGVEGNRLAAICADALRLPKTVARAEARAFFERRFTPMRLQEGFLTGYYEPEVAAHRTPGAGFTVPLHRRPPDLVRLVDGEPRPKDLDPALEFARLGPHGLVEHPDRGAIMDGALAGRGLEIAWLNDPIDAFFIHVQGSARLAFPDATSTRITFAGKSGHPYTSVGRLLIEEGIFRRPEDLTADVLAAWLRANPAEADRLMRRNRSYIFFEEVAGLDPDLGPRAAAGVQLTPGRSLAVDRRLHTFHTPIWIDAALPLGPGGALEPVRRLMIAQDTGSAIVGPARGDVFIGSGAAAGIRAGRIRHPATLFVLVPRPEAP